MKIAKTAQQPSLVASRQVAGHDQKVEAHEEGTCGVNIRGVPKAIWRKARHNALLSNLPFKVYVIKVLEQSRPIMPEANSTTTA